MADYNSARWDESVQNRFHQKFVVNNDTGCWDWIGTLNTRGYGEFSIDNRHYSAHRLLLVKTQGVVDGLVCDHLCRNHACVNPHHLEAVSNQENIRRGDGPILLKARNTSITHCPHGHEYTPDNTYVAKKGSRTCKICQSANWRRHRAKNKLRALATTRP